MKTYKGASPARRLYNLKLLKKAISEGYIAPAKTCCKCGLEHGIVMYHCEDYEASITALEVGDYNGACLYNEQYCWTCHMVHHSFRRAPEACKKYWERIASGWQPAPVMRHDFKLLEQYGIR